MENLTFKLQQQQNRTRFVILNYRRSIPGYGYLCPDEHAIGSLGLEELLRI